MLKMFLFMWKNRRWCGNGRSNKKLAVDMVTGAWTEPGDSPWFTTSSGSPSEWHETLCPVTWSRPRGFYGVFGWWSKSWDFALLSQVDMETEGMLLDSEQLGLCSGLNKSSPLGLTWQPNQGIKKPFVTPKSGWLVSNSHNFCKELDVQFHNWTCSRIWLIFHDIPGCQVLKTLNLKPSPRLPWMG